MSDAKDEKEVLIQLLHELRAPLTVIQGYTALIEQDPKFVPQGTTAINKVIENLRAVLASTSQSLNAVKQKETLDSKAKQPVLVAISEAIRDDLITFLSQNDLLIVEATTLGVTKRIIEFVPLSGIITTSEWVLSEIDQSLNLLDKSRAIGLPIIVLVDTDNFRQFFDAYHAVEQFDREEYVSMPIAQQELLARMQKVGMLSVEKPT